MTLSELQERMTIEELQVWSAHISLDMQAQQSAERKAMKRRR